VPTCQGVLATTWAHEWANFDGDLATSSNGTIIGKGYKSLNGDVFLMLVKLKKCHEKKKWSQESLSKKWS